MSPAEREQFIDGVLDTSPDLLAALCESRPHYDAKARTLERLRLHFKLRRRAVYLAGNMVVVHPGTEPFSPDVLAVLDVEPEDDERMAWVVADEGKGVDLALEIVFRGDRHKALVTNVERYAARGIGEYFVYDGAQQRLHGFRLPAGAKRYQRIVPQGGRYPSSVLGLDLGVRGGALRFYGDGFELQSKAEFFGRLEALLDGRLTEADEIDEKVAEINAVAERVATRAELALGALRATLLAMLDGRGLRCSDEARARVAACSDPATLQRWILGASTASSAEEALLG